MPDIREVLAALDDTDKRLWQQHRTEMRRSYMAAHNSVLGIAAWDYNDDAFIDLIDIKLALLFDKSGRFAATKDLVGKDAEKIEADILKADDDLAVKGQVASKATTMLQNGWGTETASNH